MLQTSTVDWNGDIQLGFGTRWVIDDPGIVGWEESTPVDKTSEARADSYGDRDTPLRARGRTVQVAGFVTTGTDRDNLVAAFRRALTLPQNPREKGELTITTAGRRLMAYGQVTGRKILMGSHWGLGRFGWAVQFQCDDYVRYGDELTATAPLTAPAGSGITPPFTPALVLPFIAKSGSVTVVNSGERLTPLVATLKGPQSGNVGIVNTTTGKTLRYALSLSSADTLVIDTRKGWAMLNNDSSRSPMPGSAVTRTLGLVPGPNTIRALGNPTGFGSPTIAVTWRPATE